MSAGGVTRWRKKPVEVEMIRWDGSEEAWQLIANHGGLPERLPDGSINIWVEASQAEMNLDEGAWAIIEQDGSGVYPCRAADHIATYEPVTAPAGTEGVVPDPPARRVATRLTLVEALRNVPLTGTMHRGALVKMADAILLQLPEASPAAFYMEGVKAERERIRQRLVCCRECGEIHGDAAHAGHYPDGEYDHPGSSPWQAAGPGALAHLDKLLGDGPVP